jgi:RIO kinase 1
MQIDSDLLGGTGLVGKIDIYELIEKNLETPWKQERREKDANNRKTYDEVFDQATLLVISKLISNKFISTVDYPVSSGKEANIFKATKPDGTPIALKIYRLATSTFKNIIRYIDGDRRFTHIRHDHRSIIFAWAKKEYKNLHLMVDTGLRVPKPITYRKNILIMEFIGDTELPAPELRMVKINKPAARYKKLISEIKKLYSKKGLVHGDFSEYNILVNNDELVIIDVGQAVFHDHPIASDLLKQDIINISKYFKKTYNTKVDAEKTILDILNSREDK